MHQQSMSAALDSALNEPGFISGAYSAFWNYSMGNQMLAMSQCLIRNIPLGPIASYKAWKDKGRQVRKGEKAITLCMPVSFKVKEKDEAGEETEGVRSGFVFRPNWFALSQTDGAEFQAEAKIPAWDKDKALAALGVAEVPFEMLNGNCQGYATGEAIAVSPVAQYPHKTRFHELAHIVLGHTKEGTMSDSEHTPRDTREVEAEAVAYILCTLLDLPGLAESRGYVQGWLQGNKVSDKSAAKIFGAADKILKAGA